MTINTHNRDDGFNKGVRASITWLHARAETMNDQHAKAVLNSAAYSLGVDKPNALLDAARAEGPVQETPGASAAFSALDIADRLIERAYGTDKLVEWDAAYSAVAKARSKVAQSRVVPATHPADEVGRAVETVAAFIEHVTLRAEVMRRFADDGGRGGYQQTADADADNEERLAASLRIVLASRQHQASALGQIAKGDIWLFDDAEGCEIQIPLHADEMGVIAREAILSHVSRLEGALEVAKGQHAGCIEGQKRTLADLKLAVEALEKIKTAEQCAGFSLADAKDTAREVLSSLRPSVSAPGGDVEASRQSGDEG